MYHKYLHRPSKGKIIAPEPEARLHRFDVYTFPGILFSKSYLAHEVTFAFQKISYKLGLSPYYSFENRDDFYLAWKSYGWADVEMLIGKIRQQLSDRNIPLIIAIFPVNDQVDDEYLNRDRDYVLYPQRRIKQICEKYDIPYIDLTIALYQAGGPGPSYRGPCRRSRADAGAVRRRRDLPGVDLRGGGPDAQRGPQGSP